MQPYFHLLLLTQVLVAAGTYPATERPESCADVASDPVDLMRGIDIEPDLGISLLQRRAQVVGKLSPQHWQGAAETLGQWFRRSLITQDAGFGKTAAMFGAVLLVAFGFATVVFLGLKLTCHSLLKCFQPQTLRSSHRQNGDGLRKESADWSTVCSELEGDIGASVNVTSLTVSKVMIGFFFVGLPHAMRAGWLASPIFFVLIVFANGYTSQLVGSLMDIARPLAKEDEENRPDLPFLGQVAFGDNARKFFNVVLISERWLILVFILLLNSSTVNVLFPQLRQIYGVGISGLLFFLTMLTPPSWLLRFSAMGIFCVILTVACLLWSACAMPKWGIEVDTFGAIHIPSIAGSLGVFQSLVGGSQLCLPRIYRVMSHPHGEFPSRIMEAVAKGFALGTFVLMCLSLLGFTIYGSQAQASFLDNVGRNLDLQMIPGLQWLHSLCNACLIVAIVSAAPLLTSPLVDATQSVVGIGKSHWTIRLAWKAALIAIAAVAALFLEGSVAAVQSLIGTLFETISCLIWPILCSLKIMPTGYGNKILMFMILVYATFVMIWATYVNIGVMLGKPV